VALLPARPILEPPRDIDLLQLVFSGECAEGRDPQAVRAAVVAALKLDDARAARLFSGRRVVLRRAVDVHKAHHIIARFAMLGAVVRAEAALPRPPQTVPPPAVAAAGASTSPAPPPLPSTAAFAPLPWGRVLRWTGLGLAGSVAAVMLGLLLGPGLGSLWPETPHPVETLPAWPPTVEARPASEAATAETPATAASAGGVPVVADADLPADMTPEAASEYRQRYLPAAEHKAFALSSSRLHAWHAGAVSTDAAREAALERCMAALRPGDDGCRIVDADGELLE